MAEGLSKPVGWVAFSTHTRAVSFCLLCCGGGATQCREELVSLEGTGLLPSGLLPESPLSSMAPSLLASLFSCSRPALNGRPFCLALSPQENSGNIHCSSIGIPLLSLLPYYEWL